MTSPSTTPPLALQLRAIAARAPMLDRPALAAAADAVEECARLRAALTAMPSLSERQADQECINTLRNDLAAARARIAELEGSNVCFTCGGPAVQHWCEQHRPSLLRGPVGAKPPFTHDQIDKGAAVYRALTGKRDNRDAALAKDRT